jgi:hypothetical protein
MNQVNARREIIREWRSLPKELRQTDEQAATFAMQIKDKYKFSSDSADPYQTVRGWLLSYLSLTRRFGVKDNAEMTDDEKSANPGLSAAERKALRSREAQEAISDHEETQKALNAAGMKTIGEVRETSDDTLLSLPDLGPGSVEHLRKTLGT